MATAKQRKQTTLVVTAVATGVAAIWVAKQMIPQPTIGRAAGTIGVPLVAGFFLRKGKYGTGMMVGAALAAAYLLYKQELIPAGSVGFQLPGGPFTTGQSAPAPAPRNIPSSRTLSSPRPVTTQAPSVPANAPAILAGTLAGTAFSRSV